MKVVYKFSVYEKTKRNIFVKNFSYLEYISYEYKTLAEIQMKYKYCEEKKLFNVRNMKSY